MPPRFDDRTRNDEFSSLIKELTLTPQIGRGRESRVNVSPIKFLTQVKRLVKCYRSLGTTRRARSSRGPILKGRGKNLQRVVIKTRVVRNRSGSNASLRKHIYYLHREGVGLGGGDANAFNQNGNVTRDEAQKWAKECERDRHHFRFIVSPEKGSEMDLKDYARKLVKQMECDLETPLSWLGIAHHNTDNSHVHILIRGKDDEDKDLVISRDYISRGARIKAREIATRELGYRREIEIQRELQRSVTEARVVGLDRDLINSGWWNAAGLIDLRPSREHHLSQQRRSLHLGRLNFLGSLGLASEVSSDIWKLEDGFLGRLQDMGTKNDIIKTMHQRMRSVNPHVQVGIIDPDKTPNLVIQGKVIHVGLVNELLDTKYALVETPDKKINYLSLGLPGTSGKRSLDIGDEIKVSINAKKLRIDGISRETGRGLELEIARS